MKTYIGDSVYAEYDDLGRIILTTENGYLDDPRNRIVLEPDHMIALAKFYEHAVHAWVQAYREKQDPHTGSADSSGHGQPL